MMHPRHPEQWPAGAFVTVAMLLSLGCAQTFRFNLGRDELTFKSGGASVLNDTLTRQTVDGVEYEVQSHYHPYELRPADPDDVNSQLAIWGLAAPGVPTRLTENYLYAAFVRPSQGGLRDPEALAAALKQQLVGRDDSFSDEALANLTGVRVNKTLGQNQISLRALVGRDGLLLQIVTSPRPGLGSPRAEAWSREFFDSLREVDGAAASPQPGDVTVAASSAALLQLAMQPLLARAAVEAR